MGREPIFYNRLVVDAQGCHVKRTHPTWGTLYSAEPPVMRIEQLRTRMHDEHTPPEVRAACESLWTQAVPACLHEATALPVTQRPKGTWVGTVDGPFFCLEEDAHRRLRPRVSALPHHMLLDGMLKRSGEAQEVDAFLLPLLSVELFDPKRSPVAGTSGAEKPFLRGLLSTDPGSMRGWQLGEVALRAYKVRLASMRYVSLRFKETRTAQGLAATLPIQPAIWGEGLARLDHLCVQQTARRVFEHEEEDHWPLNRGPAWMRPAPPRPPPAHRREVVHRLERDWTLDPLKDLVLEEKPPWATCWQDLRDSSLRRTHRSTVYLLLHGALPTNGMAFVWYWREDSFCPHTCCSDEQVPRPQWPVETYTHAFLTCPVAQAVMTWLVRIMHHMDGSEPPRTANTLLLGSRDAWEPRTRSLQWAWLHLRVGCIHHLFMHRDAVVLRRHPSSPFAVVAAVIADLQSAFLMDQRRLSSDAYHVPGVCADWLRGRRKLFTESDFNKRWMHRGLASRDEDQRPRFLLSLHAPVPVTDCLPAGVAFA